MVQLDNIANPESPQKILKEIQIKHNLRQHYLLPQNLEEIMDLVANYSQKIGIDEDIKIDNGCLLLYKIDKSFPQLVT